MVKEEPQVCMDLLKETLEINMEQSIKDLARCQLNLALMPKALVRLLILNCVNV